VSVVGQAARISLADAVKRYKAEPGAVSNAYEWYRKDAHRSGTVYIGGGRIPAVKVGSQWTVMVSDLEAALTSHQERRAHIARVTEDYEAHVLHEGDQVLTWGGYRNHGDFHFAWNNYEVGRRKSDGSWYCNVCFTPARHENNQLDCPVCTDRGSCRGDCFSITIYCPQCGTRLEF
jgi:rubrerythrin